MDFRDVDIMADVIWKDRKRTVFGLPLSFTVYSLMEDRLNIEKGFLSKSYDEIRLYRILDLSCTRSLRERIFGIGKIKVSSNDSSMGDFSIGPVKDSVNVKDMLSAHVEKQRASLGVRMSEFVGHGDLPIE